MFRTSKNRNNKADAAQIPFVRLPLFIQEQESKGKAEALRMKKKLESDVGELEIALEHSNSNNLETQKAIKKYQVQIREGQTKLEEEQRAKECLTSGESADLLASSLNP